MAASQHRSRRLITIGFIFALLCHHCFAAANFHNPRSLKRGISKDPSCPDGWLCQQQSCGNVACPTGEVCINFEGTYACAPTGLQWCALNPNTLQAVECQDGICWYVATSTGFTSTRPALDQLIYVFIICSHGNCYQKDAICCDNGAIQCKIGELCNACDAGQTCTTGASSCAAGGGGSAPTSTSKSVSQPTSAQSTPVATHSTVKSTASTVKSTTSHQSASSAPSATPTLVAAVDDFKAQGCYQDSADNRILVADSITNAKGMTVENCVAFAQKNNWQYAGVEFGM